MGFAAQSFVSLSMDPPLVALCPAKTSTSWPKIRDSGSFCINILASDQQAVCDAFARSGGNKFEGLNWSAGVTGSPILEGVLAYVDCSMEAEHDAGDHTIAVGRVQALEVISSGTPLGTWRRSGSAPSTKEWLSRPIRPSHVSISTVISELCMASRPCLLPTPV